MTDTSVDRQIQIVRAALVAIADPAAAERDKRYHKYEGYESYGIRKQQLSEILRELRPELRAADLCGRLRLAQRLMESGIEEEASVAVWQLRDSIRNLGPEHREYLDEFARSMRSWSTTDDFSTHVIRPLLHAYTEEYLALLRTWNRSRDRCLQRASVVAFTRQVGNPGLFLDETLEFCEQLIWSEDDLVRKGVGWALRDAMRVNMERILPYVIDLRRRGVSSVITLYALKDIQGGEREKVLAVKKKRTDETVEERASR